MMHAQPSLFTGEQLRPDWPFRTSVSLGTIGDLEPMAWDFIMADPAWKFELRSEKGQTKGAEIHYDTMSLEEIQALPVGTLAAESCVLWLWATAPMLPQAIDMLRIWGFRYCTMGCWHKKTKHGKTDFGYGYRLRSACEPFLIGLSGQPETTHSVRNLIEGLAREHSRKPEEAYAAAEALMPNARRADLFSRTSRPGWSAWGREAGKFDSNTTGVTRHAA